MNEAPVTLEVLPEAETPEERKFRRAMQMARKRWPSIAAAAEHPFVEASATARLLTWEGVRVYRHRVRIAFNIRNHLFGKREVANPAVLQELWLTGIDYQAFAAEAAIDIIPSRKNKIITGILCMILCLFLAPVAYGLGPVLPSFCLFIFASIHKMELLYVSSAIIELDSYFSRMYGVMQSGRFLIKSAIGCLPYIIIISVLFLGANRVLWVEIGLSMLLILIALFLLLYGDRALERQFQRNVKAGQQKMDEFFNYMREGRLS